MRIPNVFANLGLKVLAVAIAVFLWTVARGSSNVDRSFDIPVTLHDLSDELVVVDQSVESVNVRVSGSMVALRNLEPADFEYALDVSGAKPGRAGYEVDLTRFEFPPGSKVVGRSPAEISLTFERRATRPVKVRADVEGRPAQGYKIGKIEISPPRVRITGARSEVLRLSEVVTEMIDVTGATGTLEREVRVSPGAGHVWADDPRTVTVRVRIEPEPAPEPEPPV
ncbi:MAG: CdaR family protein [Deltaproteobacteria bacterium]|nr:CdaR family protein [Deltaproteobacteria bacterium]